MAATAMQTAAAESTYPVYGSVKWLKTYQAAIASPLRPADGATTSAWVLATVPAAVLTGLAFAAPIEAYAITRTSDTSFATLFRFGMIPLFLFSGTFFPVSQ